MLGFVGLYHIHGRGETYKLTAMPKSGKKTASSAMSSPSQVFYEVQFATNSTMVKLIPQPLLQFMGSLRCSASP